MKTRESHRTPLNKTRPRINQTSLGRLGPPSFQHAEVNECKLAGYSLDEIHFSINSAPWLLDL